MKAVKLIVLTFFACAIFYQARQKQEFITNISLDEAEALAQTENEQGNKYSYTYSYGEKCVIFVGGAYATGKKVSCWSGNEHPVCADCIL